MKNSTIRLAVLISILCASCAIPLLTIAQDSVIVTNGVISAAEALWPSIVSLIPTSQQAQANKDFNLSILSLSTAESVVQDAVAAGTSTNLVAQLAAVDDAITKIVGLIDQFEAANASGDPRIAAAINELHARANIAKSKNAAIRAQMVK